MVLQLKVLLERFCSDPGFLVEGGFVLLLFKVQTFLSQLSALDSSLAELLNFISLLAYVCARTMRPARELCYAVKKLTIFILRNILYQPSLLILVESLIAI